MNFGTFNSKYDNTLMYSSHNKNVTRREWSFTMTASWHANRHHFSNLTVIMYIYNWKLFSSLSCGTRIKGKSMPGLRKPWINQVPRVLYAHNIQDPWHIYNVGSVLKYDNKISIFPIRYHPPQYKFPHRSEIVTAYSSSISCGSHGFMLLPYV